MRKQKRKTFIRLALAVALVMGIVGGYIGITFYNGFFRGNVTDHHQYLYIHTGWTFDDVMHSLREQEILKNEKTFRWAAAKMDYPSRVKAGKYRLEPGMNNRTLINRLGGGFQEPVQVRFENIRLKTEFSGLIAAQIEADSLSIINILNDESRAAELGFTYDNFFTLF